MFARLVTTAYLNLVKVFSRKRPVAFTEVLRGPKEILLHLPVGPGEPWFALSALESVRHHYQNSQLSLLLPDTREALLEEGMGQIISYGRLTPLSKSFRNMKRTLRGRSFDIFVDLNPREGPDSRVLSLLSGAQVRVGYRGRKGFPFFNCQVPVGEGNEVERSLGLLRRIGVETKERALDLHISRENSRGAGRYLKSHGLREEETLLGLGLDPGDRKRAWSPRDLSELLGRMERLFDPRFLISHPPVGKQFDRIWDSLRKEPIMPSGLSLNKTAALLSHCRAFIANKSDLFPLAYGLGVPTVLVLSKSEAHSFSPPARHSLKVIEMKREGELPVEEICKSTLELIRP